VVLFFKVRQAIVNYQLMRRMTCIHDRLGSLFSFFFLGGGVVGVGVLETSVNGSDRSVVTLRSTCSRY
jgi:hypothetical protein